MDTWPNGQVFNLHFLFIPFCGELSMSSLQVVQKSDVVVVVIGCARIVEENEVDHLGRDLLEQAKLVHTGKMVLNFQSVSFMSSTMIRKLVVLHQHCKENGIDLKLCSLAPKIAEIFHVMKLTKIFDIHKDLDKAIASFNKKGWFG